VIFLVGVSALTTFSTVGSMTARTSRHDSTGCFLEQHTFNGPYYETTRVSRYQKVKTKLEFTEARDSEWRQHQLGHMQVCTLLRTDNHASTPPLSFLQAGCPSCHPANSIKAVKAQVEKKSVQLAHAS